jgi:Zn-dependent protease with chaperone function
MSAPSEPSAGSAAAWLHDGESAVRHSVTVRLDGDAIVIDGHGGVPLASLRRIDMRGIQFSRQDRPGWRLGFDEPPPSALLGQLPAGTRYGGWIDRIGLWRAALAAAILSVAVVLGTIEGLDLLARAIPFSWEQRLGDAISGDFADMACRDPAGQTLLDGLASRLSSADRPMRVTMVDMPVVNAVALPGGRILIFDGLVAQAKSPDELAGVLAHEIGHVEHRHVMVAMLRRFGLGLLFGTSGNTTQYGQALLESRYSRAAESEADDYSIEHLRAADISPAATASLFARLGREDAKMPGLFAYLASHPASADRQRRFAESARTMQNAQPALTPAQWHAVQAMCASAMPKRKRDFHFRF